MQKILFLGGSGYLGRALISHFASRGHQIYAVVRSEDGAAKVKAASAETRILSEADAPGERYDRLFNLVVDYGRSGASLSGLVAANLLYPLSIIERVEADAVVNVSTALPEGYSDYAFTKKLLERTLLRLTGRSDKACINIRLHNMYGPGSDQSNFVAFLISKMLSQEPLALSDCENSRDFIYIDDLVECLEAVSRGAGALQGQVLEVGSGKTTKLRDLVLKLRGLTQTCSPVEFGARPRNPHEPDRLVADIAPLARLGWQPRLALDQGLERTVRAMAAETARTG